MTPERAREIADNHWNADWMATDASLQSVFVGAILAACAEERKEALAEAADAANHERVLRLLAVIEAAKAMRKQSFQRNAEHAFDAALAALEEA